MQATDIKHIK